MTQLTYTDYRTTGNRLIYRPLVGGGIPPLGFTVPDPPTNLLAVLAASHAARVSFAAPLNNGGTPILGYTLTSIPPGGVDQNAGSATLSHLMTGLTNYISYTFTAHATNAVGDSVESAPSNAVTPSVVIALDVVDEDGTPMPNLTGLKWAFFEAPTPDLFTANAADKGASLSIDAQSKILLGVVTAFNAGDIGWLTFTNSDGTVSDLTRAFSGPVLLS